MQVVQLSIILRCMYTMYSCAVGDAGGGAACIGVRMAEQTDERKKHREITRQDAKCPVRRSFFPFGWNAEYFCVCVIQNMEGTL